MSSAEINALITLLEDPDESIFNHVRGEIIARGGSIVPQLERYWELNTFGGLFQKRIEDLIHSIQYKTIQDKFATWCMDEDNDLLEGVLLINQYQYPSFDFTETKAMITQIRQDIWLELNDELTALEIVRVINHILFTVHGFQGNKTNSVAPENSYMADVLTAKKGNPLSLAVLYQVLANSLDIPIYGINLPNHFILAYLDENRLGLVSSQDEDKGALFYINAFAEGNIMHKSEVDTFLYHLELPQEDHYYRPCSNLEILTRMINNLMFAYTQLGKKQKVLELKELQSLIPVKVKEE